MMSLLIVSAFAGATAVAETGGAASEAVSDLSLVNTAAEASESGIGDYARIKRSRIARTRRGLKVRGKILFSSCSSGGADSEGDVVSVGRWIVASFPEEPKVSGECFLRTTSRSSFHSISYQVTYKDDGKVDYVMLEPGEY